MVSCPARTKNLERYLILVQFVAEFCSAMSWENGQSSYYIALTESDERSNSGTTIWVPMLLTQWQAKFDRSYLE